MNAFSPVTLPKPDPAAVKAVVETLTARFGNRAVTSKAVRDQHANTLTWLPIEAPDVVVYPQTTDRKSVV